jgi:4-oxalocrotonate tautomerase
MPVVSVKVPAGALNDEQKQVMVAKITDAVVEAEGLPAVRPYVYVLIEETVERGWGMGGVAMSCDMLKAAVGKK